MLKKRINDADKYYLPCGEKTFDQVWGKDYGIKLNKLNMAILKNKNTYH
jgi:hypothetical protein